MKELHYYHNWEMYIMSKINKYNMATIKLKDRNAHNLLETARSCKNQRIQFVDVPQVIDTYDVKQKNDVNSNFYEPLIHGMLII